MLIHELIKQGVSYRNSGKYKKALEAFEQVATLLKKDENMSPLDMVVMTWEIAKLEFIFGDYRLSNTMFKKAYDMAIKLEQPKPRLIDVLRFDAYHAKMAMEADEKGKFYMFYSEFRNSIDPYYKANGDFDKSFFEFSKKMLAGEKLELTKSGSKQSANNVYTMKFQAENFNLELEYEKERFEMSKSLRKTQIRITNISIKEELRKTGLSKRIINNFFDYAKAYGQSVWISGIYNRDWCTYLLKNGFVMVKEESDAKGAILRLEHRIPDIEYNGMSNSQLNRLLLESVEEQFSTRESDPNSPKFKFWTIQKRAIAQHIIENGIYQPIFAESPFYNQSPEMQKLYTLVLESFNEHNEILAPGLIFSFLISDKDDIGCIRDYEQFKAIMKSKKPIISSMWETFAQEDMVVMELEYEANFNPILIDMNDFQLILPPVMILPPHTEDSVGVILNNISRGVISYSVEPSYLIQSHSPYIKKEQVLNIYPMFEI